MISNTSQTLIVLPHLDDEFAISPIFNLINVNKTDKVYVVFCAERNKSNISIQKKRRKESIKSMNLLKIEKQNIFFLNDVFQVNDLKLYEAKENIYNFLINLLELYKFSQIITLSFEGGNPDHDFLALIIFKISRTYDIKCFYFPSYNYEKNLFIPIRVLTPLNTQLNSSKYIKISRFCWYKSIIISSIYQTEKKTFIKLFPFLLHKFLFSNGIYYLDHIDINSVNWEKSLSFNRYRVKKNILKNIIKYAFE